MLTNGKGHFYAEFHKNLFNGFHMMRVHMALISFD